MAHRKETLEFARIAELLASINEHQEALNRLIEAKGVETESPYFPQIGPCWEVDGSRETSGEI